MFNKKKLLIGLVAFLTISSICLSNAFSQDLGGSNKSGWDVIQENKDSNLTQELPASSTRDISKRLYKEGDIEKGILNIAGKFSDFPSEKLTSMKLDGADVTVILKELAREGGKNIIIDTSVSGTITTELDKVSINEAMDLILAAAELDARVVGDTIFIASKPSMSRKGLNRRVVKSFKLSYANAVDVASVLDASIFNKGLDIKTSLKEKTEGKVIHDGIAMQATAVPPVFDPNTTSPGNMLPPADGTLPAAPTAAAAPEGAAAQTSGSSQGTTQTGANRPTRVVDYQVDPANGFNNAQTLAGSIKIQGIKSKNATYTVNNNSGGAIAVPDSRTNSVLVAGVEEDILAAEKTIQYLDRPLRQVSIDVSLVEMTRTDSEELGLSFGGDSSSVSGGFNSVNNFPSGGVVTPNGFNANSNTIAAPASYTPGSMARAVGLATVLGQNSIQLSSVKNLTKNIVVRLNTLVSKNKVKLVANPNILAVDGSESLIKLTSQIINKITTTQTQTSVTTSIDLADVGIVLNVLPKISDDGYITMRIRPSITSPGQTKAIQVSGSSNEITLIDTREVIIGDVRIKSGETLAIGGLVSERSVGTDYKTPILAEIPLIGAVFRATSKTKNKTELIILVTPKIIDDIATKVNPLKPGESIPIN